MRAGVIAIARETFDVPFAEETARQAYTTLAVGGLDIVGTAELATNLADVRDASENLSKSDIDVLIVMQASFADSSLVVAATDVSVPVVLWAFPEERTGGRLRLNAFCGINLGAFTLTNLGRQYEWILASADDRTVPTRIGVLLANPTERPPIAEPQPLHVSDDVLATVSRTRTRLADTTIGLIGDPPDGFEPCNYQPEPLRSMLGVAVDEVPLPELFARARSASEGEVAVAMTEAAAFLDGTETVDQSALDKSLRLNVGLKALVDDGGWSGVATRCWPETFTEFGGAACTPMAMLARGGTPGACEADVYGNVTGLVLGWLGGSASFVADLVDLDRDSNTGVLWHCGLAPFGMADPEAHATATIHSNRKKPLLSEFPLKPGRITIARFSQSRGTHRLVIGSGEMLRAPLAFSGTAGVVRFDSLVDDVLDTIMTEGLEHHYGIVYSDVVDELAALASLLELPVVTL